MSQNAQSRLGLVGDVFVLPGAGDGAPAQVAWDVVAALDPDGSFHATTAGYAELEGGSLGSVLGEDADSLSDPTLAGLSAEDLAIRLSGYIVLDPGSYVLEANPEAAGVMVGGVDLADGPLALGLSARSLVPVSILSVGAPGDEPLSVRVATENDPEPVSLEERILPSTEWLFGESEPEAEMIGDMLTIPLGGVALAAGLTAKFFSVGGFTDSLSDVNFDAQPAATAVVETVDYARSNTPFWNGGRSDFFAAEFTGQLVVPESGTYTLYLTSDDGSALWIDGQEVIDNDGLHAALTRTVTLELEAGAHPIRIEYFEARGNQVLELDWSGPATGGVRQSVPASALGHALGTDPSELVVPETFPAAVGEDGPIVRLIDTESDTSLGEITSGSRVSLTEAQLDRLSIDVSLPSGHPLDGQIGSVTLALDGDVRQTESLEPYALFGDAGGDYRDGGGIGAGARLLTLTFHSGSGGGGEVLATETMAFVLVNADEAPPADSGPPPVVPAVARDDTAEVDEDGSVVIGVMANDGPELSIVELGDPAMGTVTLEGDEIRYRPAPDFNGEDIFTYTVADADGGLATASVLVTIDPVNDAPVAVGDEAQTVAGSTVTLDVLQNDSDVDGDGLILVSASGAMSGSVSVEGNRLVYRADEDADGTETLSYQISDGEGGTAEGSVAIVVSPLELLDNPVDDGAALGGDDGSAGTTPPEAPEEGLVMMVDPVGDLTGLPDSTPVNGSNQYDKTHSVTFVTGGDVDTRQMIYEQGGNSRGLNFFIENGLLYAGVWNDRVYYWGEVDWGWHEISTAIEADTRYTATFVIDGDGSIDGTATLYLNGEEAGSVSGIGQLFRHTNDIGVGRVAQNSLVHGQAVFEDVPVFDGEVETIAQYNRALEGGDLAQLNAFMWGEVESDDPGNTDTGNTGDMGTGDTGTGDTGDTGTGDASQERTPGLVAEFFALLSGVSSLSEIDFSVIPDATCIVDEVQYSEAFEPFWEGGPDDNFAARFTGHLTVAEAGLYTIQLNSDDGSVFFLDGERIINHDGLHAESAKSAVVELDAGDHPIEVLYFERGGHQILELDWSGPDTGGMLQAVPVTALTILGDPGPCPATGEPICHCRQNTEETENDPVAGNTAPEAQDDVVEATLVDGMVHVALADILANDTDPDGDTLQVTSLEGAHLHGDEIMVTASVLNGQTSFTYTVSDGRGGSDTAVVSVSVPGFGGSNDDEFDLVGDNDGSFNLGGDMTEAEIEAFVQQVMSEPDHHGHHHHPDDPGKAMEHGDLMELVPRSEATHIAISDGDWFDATTWYRGEIPGDGAKVLIPEGIEVTYDGESNASLFTVRVDGTLDFATDRDTTMVVDTMVVSPSGALKIGTLSNPVEAGVNAQILIADNGDIDVGWDTALLSRGLLSHGSVDIHGAEKTSFLTVADAPMAGDTTITLSEIPEGWQVGDQLVVTGTHKQGWAWNGSAVAHRESEDEEVVITSIDGTTVTIDRPLAYDHDVPREDLAAYVGNMSRNVTITNEAGDDLPVHQRGHVMFMHSDDVDVRYAAFDDLGRTDKSERAHDVNDLDRVEADSNVKGRYSFHFHKTGTEDQSDPAMAVGNAISGAPGWGFVHHSSHAHFIDNVSYDVFGAHYVAEDGDETGIWLGNLAIKAEGIGRGESAVKRADDVLGGDVGRTGDGYFFAGRLVEAAENVAANTTNGYVWMHRAAQADPLTTNLHQPEAAYGLDEIEPDRAPIQGFRDNEAFGTYSGIIVVKANPAQGHDVRSVFDGFTNWETTQGADITYTAHYTLKDFDLIGTRDGTPVARAETGFILGQNTFDLVINGITVEGFATGIDLDNGYTWDNPDEDHAIVVIDPRFVDVDKEYEGFDASQHRILSSEQLDPGRLDFELDGQERNFARDYDYFNGTVTLSEDSQWVFLTGDKTDSIGTRARDFEGDWGGINVQENIQEVLRKDGYYTDLSGNKFFLLEDIVADRATGETLKIAHPIRLDMSDAHLSNMDAAYRGVLELGGAAPVAAADQGATREGAPVALDVLANDQDADGDALRVDGFDDPKHGDVFLLENGDVEYRPYLGFVGEDMFRYWVTDDAGNYTAGTVTVSVVSEADWPLP